MMQALKINNRFWYPVYIALLLILFLYIMFPGSLLKNYLSAQAEKRFPALSIRFEEAGFILPLGIKIRGLEVALRDNPYVPLYESEKTLIRVSIPSLLFGDMRITFSSRVNGGEISGVYEEGDKDICNITAIIDDIILDEKPFIHPKTCKYIEGLFKGKVRFTGNPSDLATGNGDIYLEAVKGSIKPAMPLFDVRDIGFEKIGLTGVLDNMRLNLKDISITGGPFNGRAKGDIQLKRDIYSSGIKLSAEITPGPTMKKEMPEVLRALESSKLMKGGKLRLNIEGTLENPTPVIR